MKNSLKKIGNTPMIQLSKIAEGGLARVFAKVEGENFGGSIKDRVAKRIIDEAFLDGRLKEGGVVVEATSGNTGIGLAFVAKAYGCRAIIVMPDTMSMERRLLIEKFGGEVVLTNGADGMQGAVEKAKEIVKNTKGAILADQFENLAGVRAHYEGTAVEIDAQVNGGVDVFVAGVGTGGTLTGVGRYLKEKNPSAYVVAVEPESSPLLSKGWASAHKIQGIGANFVPGVLDRSVYDEVVVVSDEDAFLYTRQLKEKEGVFAGLSSGANVAVCVALAKRKEFAGKTIVTVLPDEGGRYVSTGVFDGLDVE